MDSAIRNELLQALEEERDRLRTELKSIAKSDSKMGHNWVAGFPQLETSPSLAHSSLEEQADEVEEYEALLDAEHILEVRLLNVLSAMERIRNNEYGRCRRCGKDIPLERLRANPAALFDIEHENG
jgi:RNA polymerase-binding transcription factor DksA